MERCIYPPALPIYSAFLYPHTSQTTPYGTFLSLKYRNSLYYWGIRYTTERENLNWLCSCAIISSETFLSLTECVVLI